MESVSGSVDSGKRIAIWLALMVIAVAVTLTSQYTFWMAYEPAILRPYRLFLPLQFFGGAIIVTLGIALFPRQFVERLRHVSNVRPQWIIAGLAAGAAIVPMFVAFLVLEEFVNSGDEAAYLVQGEWLSQGRLYASAPELGASVVSYRTWIYGDRLVSQYPPGWPLAIASAIGVGLPIAATNSIIGALSVVILYLICRRWVSPTLALLISLMFALSPFYVMHAASYFSHSLSSLFLLLIILCLLRAKSGWMDRYALCAGALIGASVLTRYFSILAIAPAALFWILGDGWRVASRRVVAIGFGGLPFLIGLLLYHYVVLGNPLATTYVVISEPDTFPSVRPSDIALGLHLMVRRLLEMPIWLSPGFVLLYLLCVAWKIKARSIEFFDLFFPCIVFLYVFFPVAGGNRYGPRYYFDATAIMGVTIASAAPWLSGYLRAFTSRPIIVPMSVCGIIYSVAIWPLVFAGYHAEVRLRREPLDLVARNGIANAIVVIGAQSGPGMSPRDLVRNPLDNLGAAPVIYVRPDADLGALRAAFPNREIWQYLRSDFGAPGTLSRLR